MPVDDPSNLGLFLDHFSSALIFHLISATFTLVKPWTSISITYSPRPSPPQWQLKAYYLYDLKTPSSLQVTPFSTQTPITFSIITPSLPYIHIQLPCHSLAFLYSDEKTTYFKEMRKVYALFCRRLRLCEE